MRLTDTNTIKVADFGICRIDGNDAGDATQQTQVGNVLGTPHYMSPEQVIGEKVDSRSDLFSAGVVLYQLLTGHVPFEGDTLISVAYKITKTDPPSLDKVRPELPLSLRRIVERALKKQPEKRFQSGEEFAQALIGVARELDDEGQKKGRTRGVPLGDPVGADDGGRGRDHDDADRDGPLQAAVRRDDGPGEGLRRLAREVHGDAERRAAAVRGLGRDGRLRAGDAGAPGLRLHERRRPPGDRAREQRRRGSQQQVRAAGRRRRCRRTIPASPCRATG